MKKPTTFAVFIAAMSAVIVGSFAFAGIRYMTTDRGMLGKKADQSQNVNVMLQRPENWHQIATQLRRSG